MSGDRAALERECQVFTRFVVRGAATPYVIDKYVDAHRVLPGLAPTDRFDRWLVALAQLAPGVTRLADAYARLFASRGALRKKLVLLLAVLESSPPFHETIDHAPPRPPVVAVMQILARGAGGALAALAGTVLFAPLRMIARIRGPRA